MLGLGWFGVSELRVRGMVRVSGVRIDRVRVSGVRLLDWPSRGRSSNQRVPAVCASAST